MEINQLREYDQFFYYLGPHEEHAICTCDTNSILKDGKPTIVYQLIEIKTVVLVSLVTVFTLVCFCQDFELNVKRFSYSNGKHYGFLSVSSFAHRLTGNCHL